MKLLNKQVVLGRRPVGKPRAGDFDVVESSVPDIRQRQALVQNLYFSLDAGFRNWMDEDSGDDVLPAMPLNKPVMGLTLSRVIESKHPEYVEGQLLMGRLAWEEYSIASDDDFLVPLVDDGIHPLSYHLGILGDTGMSAYFGLHDIANPGTNETVLISAAGGAVGSVAGQIAHILGAKRVVGFAGSDEKCDWLRDKLGYDATINYRSENLEQSIAAACPDGIDIYFDNVGGPLLEPVLNQINNGARIAFCGAVADYTRTENSGPSNLFQLVTNCARIEGFLTHTKVDRYDEARRALSQWLSDGQLVSFEHMYEGIECCGQAFSDLFAGKNFGKTIVSANGPALTNSVDPL
ncbi:MAG: NADP-dependent oxidoreductase [bacterium]